MSLAMRNLHVNEGCRRRVQRFWHLFALSPTSIFAQSNTSLKPSKNTKKLDELD